MVEWRVFFLESAIEGISFPFFLDPALLASLQAARVQGNEVEEVSEGGWGKGREGMRYDEYVRVRSALHWRTIATPTAHLRNPSSCPCLPSSLPLMSVCVGECLEQVEEGQGARIN